MIPINPFTFGAASLGVSKLADAAQPIADFALRVLQSGQAEDVSTQETPSDPREQLAHDAQQALRNFARGLEDKLAELGITLDTPIELKRSPSGRIVVANGHAHKDAIEGVLAGTQLGGLFSEAAAKFQQLESYPESQIHAAAPRTFQLRYGGGELHGGFVA